MSSYYHGGTSSVILRGDGRTLRKMPAYAIGCHGKGQPFSALQPLGNQYALSEIPSPTGHAL